MAKRRLETYRAKRDFGKTAEPSGDGFAHRQPGRRYLIQKHDATRMHFDFRLELDGVLLSWAVPNGPSYDPKEKRLAVHVEDHPLDYGDFEGTIPKGEYGGGTVMLWDEGTWTPVGDPEAGLDKGDFKFVLQGERLKGKWVLVRMKPKKGERSRHENWLLIKEKDAFAEAESVPVIERVTRSVRSNRTMEEIAGGHVEWRDSGFQIKRQEGAVGTSIEPDDKPAKFVEPQLATLAETPPAGDDWLHEIKYDGYRAIAAVGGGEAVIYTRRGHDWTDKFHPLVRPLIDLPCRAVLLDGEIAVTEASGATSFGALQDAIADGSGAGMGYYVFDILSLEGEDLRKRPLVERKQRLADLLGDQPRRGPLYYSNHIVGHGADMLAQVCGMGLEGIISKRADQPYRSGRTRSWLKAKCAHGQEFVIIGWQPSSVKARPFSSLLLASREGGELTYRGRVGSGFGERELDALWPELKTRAVKSAPAPDVPDTVRRKAKFVKPELVAEIAFRGFTDEGAVRQASYKGLRADKPAEAVRTEQPVADDAAAAKPVEAPMVITVDDTKDDDAAEIGGVRVTHPDKVVFPGQGITKRQLAEYVLKVADRMLPHVADRPLSLVRCPDGTEGDCFFQKHASPGFPRAIKPIRIKEKTGKGDYLYIADERGLVACIQMGVIEFHIWGSHNRPLEKPDRLVFDLDPDEGLGFADIKAAARDIRDRLSAIGLTTFPMVTGGKGIHLVAPLAPKHDWETVKAFAEAVARTIAADEPDRYLAVATKAKRTGRIFIDYLRNGRGATAIAPYSPRARKGAPVAWPVSWTGLGRLKDARPVTVETAAAALKRQKADPWAGYSDVNQVLPV